jgi:uncharacterized C2H2 Zn-finger protein
MKRHERPYGCTFGACNKTFGSKNDWKRHENSQHFHLETWRCEEERSEGGRCATVFYRRMTFQDHLVKAHQKDDEQIKSALEKCRIGRNSQSRFWCGFCNTLIDLKKRGVDAWTERFDHIDDHFVGRHGNPKQSIKDWIPLDIEQSKYGAKHSDTLGSPVEGLSDSAASSSVAESPIAKSPRPSGPSGTANHPPLQKYTNAENSVSDITSSKSVLPSKIPRGTTRAEEFAQLERDFESTFQTDTTEHTKSTWGNSSLSKRLLFI